MNYKTTWNEKYRPTRLSHVVGKNMTLFENIKKTNQMTNLIIYGKAGVGKTSAIIALAYELYKEKVGWEVCQPLSKGMEATFSWIYEQILTKK